MTASENVKNVLLSVIFGKRVDEYMRKDVKIEIVRSFPHGPPHRRSIGHDAGVWQRKRRGFGARKPNKTLKHCEKDHALIQFGG